MSKGLYINGEWRTGAGARFTSENPANGAVLWQGESADNAQIDQAFQAAQSGFSDWSKRPLSERIDQVKRYQSSVKSHQEDLARLIAQETGKAYWDASGEAQAVYGKIDLSIKAYYERSGEKAQKTDFGQMSLHHKPHGVLSVLGPYNFPVHLPNGHIVPALLAGNTLVFKPSEVTPLTGEFMVSLWDEAGLDKGVLNLVQGGVEIGKSVLNHPLLKGVLFTGSAQAGCQIHKQFGGRPEILLALEMGGNNPLIAWEISDVEKAAGIIIHSAFVTSGQRCSCARRLILPEGAEGEALIEAVLKQVAGLKIGAWDETPQPFMGPVVHTKAAQAVLTGQDDLLKKGGKALLEVKSLAHSENFVTPGIFDMTGAGFIDYEIFGPVLQLVKAPDFSTALKLANHTRFGLSAGLISESEALWEEFKRQIHAGVVNWNRPITGASSALPFGGVGLSGNHRPSAYYAADYCAYPSAHQEAETLAHFPLSGFKAPDSQQ